LPAQGAKDNNSQNQELREKRAGRGEEGEGGNRVSSKGGKGREPMDLTDEALTPYTSAGEDLLTRAQDKALALLTLPG
jgi:hypothetical protein